MKWWTIGIAAVAACVVIFVLVGNTWRAQDRQDARNSRQAIEQANTICSPLRTKSITHHEVSWSQGPYWKVVCSDNSVRVVAVP